MWGLVDAYRSHGHLKACLDPLGLASAGVATPLLCSLDPQLYGLSDRMSFTKLQQLLPAFPQQEASLADVVQYLEHMYCGSISLQAAHVNSLEEKEWLVKTYELSRDAEQTAERKLRLMKLLLQSQTFDNFMAKKFTTVKRYGAEGAESLMVFFDEVLRKCGSLGTEEVVLGIAHRGRLNLLTTILQLPQKLFFHKLLGNEEFLPGAMCTGDVISHMVSSCDVVSCGGEVVHVSMLPNPSHLESVNPVVLGKVRARQLSRRDGPYASAPSPPAPSTTPGKVLPLQVHGDAAFSAQGVVTECLGLSSLPHFEVGGCLHLIVNNQLGFTTEGHHGRSSHHSSDHMKSIGGPVLHVNGAEPEDVLRATALAMEYRNKFQKDVLVNMVCYRRWGHNELDNPALTQPHMYGVIDNRKSLPDTYSQRLQAENLVREEEIETLSEEYFSQLGESLKASAAYNPPRSHLLGRWRDMVMPGAVQTLWDTGYPLHALKFVGMQSVNVPSSVVVNERLKKSHIEMRIKQLEKGERIDWATAEALSMGSLLCQGFNVRLSGQDVGRGTFSHRHAMFVCQDSEDAYIPLNYISPDQTAFLEVANSPLSEEAVLGFEYGFSIESPQHLVLWEAQFGDFFNGAQIIVDTLVSSGEAKWLVQSGLVLLLPHGYDGAGPDHSSGYVERFLQLCDSAEDCMDGDSVNLHVAHPTTPAQYFHLLRRQMIRNFRKPLVVFSPKILLRLPAASSSITEFAPGSTFQPVLSDTSVNDPKCVQRVVFCSGKHYYALDSYRKERNIDNAALVRLELLSPFPSAHLHQELLKYPNATEWIWSQEEPVNKGPWSFIQPRFDQQLNCKLSVVSRKPSAASSVGVTKVHQEEVKKLLTDTFPS